MATQYTKDMQEELRKIAVRILRFEGSIKPAKKHLKTLETERDLLVNKLVQLTSDPQRMMEFSDA